MSMRCSEYPTRPRTAPGITEGVLKPNVCKSQHFTSSSQVRASFYVQHARVGSPRISPSTSKQTLMSTRIPTLVTHGTQSLRSQHLRAHCGRVPFKFPLCAIAACSGRHPSTRCVYSSPGHACTQPVEFERRADGLYHSQFPSKSLGFCRLGHVALQK